MTIDYLGHSGFLAETQHALLLFDYYRGDLSLIENKAAGKPLYVFVSHIHGDHFDPAVFSLAGKGRPVFYLLSFDIRGSRKVPKNADVRFLEADQTYEIPGLGTVQTLLSTDEGVAFAVETGQESLFHAGDLHWWDWPGEDPEWLADQEKVFKREIGLLNNKRPDAAFVVLDDRLEDNFAEGMAYFLTVCRPKYVLPMHFWKDRKIIERYLTLPGGVPEGVRILDTA
ncbi:MAG: MBL fold metallo-hydrolase, partial [Lachnospiraceae bacterium]|nr:MBL fold metallo-hydrolase [Lachnospiraceae bacterium]